MTLHTYQPVRTGQTVAGTRVFSLIIVEREIVMAEALCETFFPLIQVKPFKACRAGGLPATISPSWDTVVRAPDADLEMDCVER